MILDGSFQTRISVSASWIVSILQRCSATDYLESPCCTTERRGPGQNIHLRVMHNSAHKSRNPTYRTSNLSATAMMPTWLTSCSQEMRAVGAGCLEHLIPWFGVQTAEHIKAWRHTSVPSPLVLKKHCFVSSGAYLAENPCAGTGRISQALQAAGSLRNPT